MRTGHPISVIIPTLNEAPNLSRTVEAVRKNDHPVEIILADGGSNDLTLEITKKLDIKIVQSPIRRRSSQMNFGATHAAGDTLLFLHADTLLPGCGLRNIISALRNPKVVGGGFCRKFDSPSLFLWFSCLVAELRNRTVGWHLGDQAIFCGKKIFEDLGGFKEIDRFEDLDFSRRLAARGKVVTLRPPVVTSARRFQHEGAVRRTWRDLLMTLKYLKEKPAARV